MQQQSDSCDAPRCTGGCGFFGNAACHGMCSVCWKKSGTKAPSSAPSPPATDQVIEPDTVVIATGTTTGDTMVETTTAEAGTSSTNDEAPPEKPVQTNKSRCWECKKKIGLTGIECRCGFVYCGIHRYADQHECTFDHKAADIAELAKRNPGGGHFNKVEKL
ncbi:hypothetical protein H310_13541 [Aphanomyces invadans]|uniref:AN1-type domain-containing protein n=1 Tax=Aphanomyces invadans TaxID=157072 RepID=A0A024TCY0_9STRA|nr:hypothetical protein H310_13541 [Aphanomyces invadans]ETV92015.1 hypothetical protein H310_13541 [Aphanomyces invadans]|eukprot:XP_008879312.1 hypothetical protein H310_13541 [Aphanomyces invadans]